MVTPRLQTSAKRRPRKTAILTDTPEKNALAEEKRKKNDNNAKKGKDWGKRKGKGKCQEKATRRILQES